MYKNDYSLCKEQMQTEEKLENETFKIDWIEMWKSYRSHWNSLGKRKIISEAKQKDYSEWWVYAAAFDIGFDNICYKNQDKV